MRVQLAVEGTEMAIGRLVRGHLGEIFAYCDTTDHEELERLLDRKYSKQTFGLSFPFCKEVKDIDPEESKRFWTDVYMVRGKRVRVISQWIEKHRPLFIAYLEAHDITTAVEALAREDEWSSVPRGTTTLPAASVARTSSRVNARYRSYAIGNAQNAFIRNILSSLGTEAFNERDWFETKAHFDTRCAYCGDDGELLVEHAIPINRGSLGEHRLGNIVPSCRKCNADKGGRDFRDFLGENATAIARIEEYMDSRNYVPLEDSEQMKLVLNMAHSEVAALADRYVTLMNSLFPAGTGVVADVASEDDQRETI